jgi:hypothetical protein
MLRKNLKTETEKSLLKINYQLQRSVSLFSLFAREANISGPDCAAHQDRSGALEEDILL